MLPDSYTQQEMIDAVALRPNGYEFLGPEWFTVQSITRRKFWYDLKIGKITSIPPSEPGAPGTTLGRNLAHQVELRTFHHKTTDYIDALEAMDQRMFGTVSNQLPENSLLEAMDLHADSHDMTVHVAKAKSLFDGLIMGPPESVGGAPQTAFDYYSNGHFGAQYSLNLALGSAGLLAKCSKLKTQFMKRARGINIGRPIAYIGETIFDAFRAHADFEKGVERYSDGEYLRSGATEFEFGGILWRLTEETYIDYQGNTTRFVPINEGRIVPQGLPAATKLVVSPAVTIDQIGRRGMLKTPTQAVRPDRTGWDFTMQSCFAAVVKRPDLVFKLTNT